MSIAAQFFFWLLATSQTQTHRTISEKTDRQTAWWQHKWRSTANYDSWSDCITLHCSFICQKLYAEKEVWSNFNATHSSARHCHFQMINFKLMTAINWHEIIVTLPNLSTFLWPMVKNCVAIMKPVFVFPSGGDNLVKATDGIQQYWHFFSLIFLHRLFLYTDFNSIGAKKKSSYLV